MCHSLLLQAAFLGVMCKKSNMFPQVYFSKRKCFFEANVI